MSGIEGIHDDVFEAHSRIFQDFGSARRVGVARSRRNLVDC
jgi:hypothetical protein